LVSARPQTSRGRFTNGLNQLSLLQGGDMSTRKTLIALGVVFFATSAAAVATFNFGEFRAHQLDSHSEQLFGTVTPVGASSTDSISAQEANSDPTALVTL